MKQIIATIQGMSCQGCINTVKNTLLKVNGVHEVTIELSSGKATILCDDEIRPEKLATHLSNHTNYKATLIKEEILPDSSR